MTGTVTVRAPAKVNLRLIVLGREGSGYHFLETIFCGISLSDRIEVEGSRPGIHLGVTGGVDTGRTDENLVVRAARSFYVALGEDPAIGIRLHKQIPAAAGLGGGSSDAAATLRALNTLHDHPLSSTTLLSLGAKLGSDVPFFLTSTPYALGWSRGERLLELEPLPPRPVLIAHSGTPISTRAAFQRLAELRGGEQRVEPLAFAHTALASWEAVRSLAVNDLELVAFERIPGLPHAIRGLLDGGACIALLAGSGASIFGIFRDEQERDAAEEAIQQPGTTTWRATTLTSWPQPCR